MLCAKQHQHLFVSDTKKIGGLFIQDLLFFGPVVTPEQYVSDPVDLLVGQRGL